MFENISDNYLDMSYSFHNIILFNIVLIVTLFSRSSLWFVGLVIPILSISLQLNCLEGSMVLQPSNLQIFEAGGVYWSQFLQMWNIVSFDISIMIISSLVTERPVKVR